MSHALAAAGKGDVNNFCNLRALNLENEIESKLTTLQIKILIKRMLFK